MKQKKYTKGITKLLVTLLFVTTLAGCGGGTESGSIVGDEEVLDVFEDRSMEIDIQSSEYETRINAVDDRMTIHYWSNEEDDYYIQMSLESSLDMASQMEGEVTEHDGITEIIIDWSVVGQEFYSVHLYGDHVRVHVRLYDLDELDEVRNLIIR